RRSVRPLRRDQPGDPAQRPEPPLAAALAAAVRARPVPVLPRAGHPRRTAARAHGDRRRQLGDARRRRHPVGAVAMVRVALVAVLLVLGATACGERSEPTGPNAHLYPVTVQTGDRPLVVTEPARRIVVLDPDAQAILEGL